MPSYRPPDGFVETVLGLALARSASEHQADALATADVLDLVDDERLAAVAS